MSDPTPLVARTIECADCHLPFNFSVRDQEFYKQKGFTSDPKRCKPCRDAKKGIVTERRELFEVPCSECGKPAFLPFKPHEGRVVYCSECFKEHR